MNDYFNDAFYFVYVLLLLPFFIALIFYALYWCACHDTWHQRRIPSAIALAALGSLLLFIWIIIFITLVYEHDEVYIGRGPREEEEGKPDPNYSTKLSKITYILGAAGIHLFNAIFYTFMWSSAICLGDQKWGLGKFA
jgi:hypothetical protein